MIGPVYLQSKERKVGVESSEEQRQEGDVEKRERLVGDMGSDHQADSVAKGEAHVKDPGDQVLADDLGRGVQPEVGDQGHANIGEDANQSRGHGQVLVLASLDDMLEATIKIYTIKVSGMFERQKSIARLLE